MYWFEITQAFEFLICFSTVTGTNAVSAGHEAKAGDLSQKKDDWLRKWDNTNSPMSARVRPHT